MRKIILIYLILFAFASCTDDAYLPAWIGTPDNTTSNNDDDGDNDNDSDVVDSYYFPEQLAPTKLTIITDVNVNTGASLSFDVIDLHRLAQSLSGLAAQGVNEGTNDEMIWINNTNEYYATWLSLTKSRLGIAEADVTQRTLWEAVDYFKDKGLVKGYVLYSRDESMDSDGVSTGYYEDRTGTDTSVNAATVIAGLNGCVIFSEELAETTDAINSGISKLADATTLSTTDVWSQYSSQVNKDVVFSIDPKVAHNRDMVIAHKGMIYFGVDTDADAVVSGMNAITPVLGWNKGGEDAHTGLVSKYGLFNTVSNWVNNMTTISAGSKSYNLSPAQIGRPDASQIDFDETGKIYHSFVMSDGDNTAWMSNDFHKAHFLGYPNLNTIPMSWTGAMGLTSMLNPAAWTTITTTMPSTNSFIEFGGGYQYPDLFGSERTDQLDTFRDFMKKVNMNMKRGNVKMFGYISRYDVNSSTMQSINQIIVDEIEDLTGVYAVQYSPYNAGEGEVYYYTNPDGIDIPVISPKYLLWEDVSITNAGDPSEVSALVNAETDDHTITMVHAWSQFAGMPTDDNQNQGMYAVAETVGKLDADVKVVGIEELFWRIRMKDKPEQTKALLGLD